MELGSLVKLGWAIAEHEAIALKATVIEPIHFLLAALKIADPKFPEQLDKLDITSDEWKNMSKEAKSLRHWLDVLPEHVADARRRLRRRLVRMIDVGEVKNVKLLHRSRKSRAAFYDAMSECSNDVLTLRQVVESMFYLGFVDVSDMRWLGETKSI